MNDNSNPIPSPIKLGAWLNIEAPKLIADAEREFERALEFADNRVPTNDRWDVWNSPMGRSGDTRDGAVWPVLFGSPREDGAFLRAIGEGARRGRKQCLYTSLPTLESCMRAGSQDSPYRGSAMASICTRYQAVITAGVSVLIFDGACQRRDDVQAVWDTLYAAGLGDKVVIGAEPLCAAWSSDGQERAAWTGPRICSTSKALSKIRTGAMPAPGAGAWGEIAVICAGMEDADNPKRRGPSVEHLELFVAHGLRLIVGNLSPEPREWIRAHAAGTNATAESGPKGGAS